VSLLPTFTEPVTFGTDTAVNSLPGSSGDGDGDGFGDGDGVGFEEGDGLGVGFGDGAAATATVCAEVLLTVVYPALEPVTFTETFLPTSAATSL
jgi:hypothetical protein